MNINESSSVLSTLKNLVPSQNRSSTCGVGDRSEIGMSPIKGQKKLLGNLDAQSKGMVGVLDTQGKSEPTMFASHNGNDKNNSVGSYTPSVYRKLYKLTEGASGKNSTGVAVGKIKNASASSLNNVKYARKMDYGTGDNTTKISLKNTSKINPDVDCGCTSAKNIMSESLLLGSLLALNSAHIVIESILNQ